MNTSLPRKKIREWRLERFLTLKELAALIGVKFQTIWAWEHDKSRPEFRNIRALAKAFEIEPQQIIMPEPESKEGKRAA